MNLMYLVGFAFLTLVALIVSLTLKFEHRNGTAQQPSHISSHHEEEHTETNNTSQDERRVNNIARNTQPHDHNDLPAEHPAGSEEPSNGNIPTAGPSTHVDSSGVSRIKYTRSGTDITQSTGTPKIADINNLFSNKPFLKMDWNGNQVLAFTPGSNDFSTGADQPNTSFSYESGYIRRKVNNDTYYLDKYNNNNSLYSITTSSNTKFHINSAGIVCDLNEEEIRFVRVNTGVIRAQRGGNGRLVMVSSNGGDIQFMFVSIPADDDTAEVNLNRIEYFGITVPDNYHFPLAQSSLDGIQIRETGTQDTGNDQNTRVVPFQQFLGSVTKAVRSFGLFAKVNTTAPSDGPSIVDPSGYNGFKNVDTNVRIGYITTLPNGETISLDSLWGSDDVNGDFSQPRYSIYIVLDTGDNVQNDSHISFQDNNSTKGTQTVVIFGSHLFDQSGQSSKPDYGTSLERGRTDFGDILDTFGNLTDNHFNASLSPNNYILTKDSPSYLGHGQYNMNAIAFLSFNTIGQGFQNQTIFARYFSDSPYQTNGWFVTPNSTHTVISYTPNSFYRTILTEQHFLDYYRVKQST